MDAGLRAAAPEHPFPQDAEMVAARVREALAPLLGEISGPLTIHVRVGPDRVEARVLGPGEGPGRDGWSFANWFRDRLRSRRLTQESAAALFGVSAKTVNRWVRGDTEPRFRELVMIYDALGESPFVPQITPSSTRHA